MWSRSSQFLRMIRETPAADSQHPEAERRRRGKRRQLAGLIKGSHATTCPTSKSRCPPCLQERRKERRRRKEKEKRSPHLTHFKHITSPLGEFFGVKSGNGGLGSEGKGGGKEKNRQSKPQPVHDPSDFTLPLRLHLRRNRRRHRGRRKKKREKKGKKKKRRRGGTFPN